MNELKAQPATLTAVVQIKRKETGKVEEHTLILTPLPEKQEPEKAKEGQ
jgi:hypothetical protein